MIPTTSPLKRLWVLLKTHFYGVSIALALLVTALATVTDGFAAMRSQIGKTGAWFRETSADMTGQVWCTTSFTNDTGQTLLGHYPGMSAEEVVKFHADAAWLLRDASIERETLCYRSWQAAFEAAAIDPPLLPQASDEDYKNAVLSFYLGGGDERVETPVTVEIGAADDPPVTKAEGWCFSEIKNRDNLIVTVPHPPGGRASIEAVLDTLKDRSAFTEYLIRSTICFKNWAEAADYITGGEVELAATATQEEYEAAIAAWQAAKR